MEVGNPANEGEYEQPMKFTSHTQGAPCWVDLATTDQAEAKAFYADLFGWECQDNPMDESRGRLLHDGDCGRGRSWAACTSSRRTSGRRGFRPTG